MDLVRRAYVGEKDRKAKNAKQYILVRSALIGKQKRNIYIKDSKEYIKHNGKYVQLKKYMKNMIDKEILQINKEIEKTNPCKKDCAAENKICNKKTHRCNKIKEEKVPKRVAIKKQKDAEIYEHVFKKHFLKHYGFWVDEKRIHDIRQLERKNEKSAYDEILKDAKNAWDRSHINMDNIGKEDFYKMAKGLIKKHKKPLNEMTLSDVDNEYYEYNSLKRKKQLKADLKLLHENPTLYAKKYPQYFKSSS